MNRKNFLTSFLLGTLILITSPLVFADEVGNSAKSQDVTSFNGDVTLIQKNGPDVETQTKEFAEVPTPVCEVCEGNNHENNNFTDNCFMGGPLVGISWVPTHSVTVNRIEVFTGETETKIALAIWSDDGGNPSKPLSNLGNTAYVPIVQPNSWQGADLETPLAVTAGTKYWVIFDPEGGEQCPATMSGEGIQQTYWGSYSGDITGGASWFGPFGLEPTPMGERWKFRMMCFKCLGLACTISGTNGGETLSGTDYDDVICGRGGNDIIWAKKGNDTVCGGEGDDVLMGEEGYDRLDGGPGNDILNGGKKGDMLDGGEGNDVLLGKAGNDMLFGGSGDDYLEGSAGNDLLDGGPDNDVCENQMPFINCENIGPLFLYGGPIPSELQSFIKLE